MFINVRNFLFQFYSVDYQKQRKRVVKLEARLANKRRDFRHKLSKTLVNNHDLLAFEDLNVKGPLKNHCLARGISKASWSDFIRMVEYKAAGEHKIVVKVSRFFASTRICSCSGAKKRTSWAFRTGRESVGLP